MLFPRVAGLTCRYQVLGKIGPTLGQGYSVIFCERARIQLGIAIVTSPAKAPDPGHPLIEGMRAASHHGPGAVATDAMTLFHWMLTRPGPSSGKLLRIPCGIWSHLCSVNFSVVRALFLGVSKPPQTQLPPHLVPVGGIPFPHPFAVVSTHLFSIPFAVTLCTGALLLGMSFPPAPSCRQVCGISS
jgi:hypothetical protein